MPKKLIKEPKPSKLTKDKILAMTEGEKIHLIGRLLMIEAAVIDARIVKDCWPYVIRPEFQALLDSMVYD